MLEVLILVVLAAFTAIILARTFPEATKTWFQRIFAFRKVTGAVGGIVLGLFFLGTGVNFLVFAGFAIMMYSTLFLLFEKPHSEVREWIGI